MPAVLPAEMIKTWSKMKSQLPTVVRKVEHSTWSAEDKKTLAKDVEKLFATFDQGLRGAMDKANKAKGAEKTKAALLEVRRIIKEYEGKVGPWAEKGGQRKAVVDAITNNLTKLDAVAKQALASLT